MQDEEQNVADELKSLTEDVGQLLAGFAGTQDISWLAPASTKEAIPDAAASIPEGETSTVVRGTSDWLSWATQPVLQTVTSGVAPTGSTSGSGLWKNLLSPVLGTVLGMFGDAGGSTQAGDASLNEFSLPDAQSYNLGFVSGEAGFVNIERQADGGFRGLGGETGTIERKVVVEVQALDSQSFLDRRRDIADAVRLALLESHDLQDVISKNE